ncbi:MAG: T9SS type A sorting domain-containing protein [Saprospiraceae bacterium]|nr:T9SS type A sorting domain-containing protein [Saprospiraceae bacterium]
MNQQTWLLILMVGCITYNSMAQSLKIESTDGETTTLDLAATKNIVFENNNLVISGNTCGKKYFNIFFNQKLSFRESTTAVNDVVEAKILTVYPNPAISFINVDRSKEEVTDAVIYNTTGQAIITQQLNNKHGKIDISMLTDGIYLLKVDQQTIKFLKQ